MATKQPAKKPTESAAVRKARLLEEEKKQQQAQKKKKLITTLIIIASVIVIAGCAIGIPLGIRAKYNSYTKVELKNLCNDSGTSLSAWVRELNGRKVQITGYLLQCTSTTRFLAGSSNAACPFSTQKYVTNVIPAVYEDGSEFDSMKIDVSVPYTVYGTLHVGETLIAYYIDNNGDQQPEYAGMVLYVEKFEKAK